MVLSLFKQKPLVRVILTKDGNSKQCSTGSTEVGMVQYCYLENRLKNLECKLLSIKRQSKKIFQCSKKDKSNQSRRSSVSSPKRKSLSSNKKQKFNDPSPSPNKSCGDSVSCVSICSLATCNDKCEESNGEDVECNNSCDGGESGQDDSCETTKKEPDADKGRNAADKKEEGQDEQTKIQVEQTANNESDPRNENKPNKKEKRKEKESNKKKKKDACPDNLNDDRCQATECCTQFCVSPITKFPSSDRLESSKKSIKKDKLLNTILKKTSKQNEFDYTWNFDMDLSKSGMTSGTKKNPSITKQKSITFILEDDSKRNIANLGKETSLARILEASKLILERKNLKINASSNENNGGASNSKRFLPNLSARRSSPEQKAVIFPMEKAPEITNLMVGRPAANRKCSPQRKEMSRTIGSLDFKKKATEPERHAFYQVTEGSQSKTEHFKKPYLLGKNDTLQNRNKSMTKSENKAQKFEINVRELSETSYIGLKNPDTSSPGSMQNRNESQIKSDKKPRTSNHSVKRDHKLKTFRAKKNASKISRHPSIDESDYLEENAEEANRAKKNLSNNSIKNFNKFKPSKKELSKKNHVNPSGNNALNVKNINHQRESTTFSPLPFNIKNVKLNNDISNIYVYHPSSGSFISYAKFVENSIVTQGETCNNQSSMAASEFNNIEIPFKPPSNSITHSPMSPYPTSSKTKYCENVVNNPSEIFFNQSKPSVYRSDNNQNNLNNCDASKLLIFNEMLQSSISEGKKFEINASDQNETTNSNQSKNHSKCMRNNGCLKCHKPHSSTMPYCKQLPKPLPNDFSGVNMSIQQLNRSPKTNGSTNLKLESNSEANHLPTPQCGEMKESPINQEQNFCIEAKGQSRCLKHKENDIIGTTIGCNTSNIYLGHSSINAENTHTEADIRNEMCIQGSLQSVRSNLNNESQSNHVDINLIDTTEAKLDTTKTEKCMQSAIKFEQNELFQEPVDQSQISNRSEPIVSALPHFNIVNYLAQKSYISVGANAKSTNNINESSKKSILNANAVSQTLITCVPTFLTTMDKATSQFTICDKSVTANLVDHSSENVCLPSNCFISDFNLVKNCIETFQHKDKQAGSGGGKENKTMKVQSEISQYASTEELSEATPIGSYIAIHCSKCKEVCIAKIIDKRNVA